MARPPRILWAGDRASYLSRTQRALWPDPRARRIAAATTKDRQRGRRHARRWLGPSSHRKNPLRLEHAMRTWTTQTTVAGLPEAVLDLLCEPDAIARWAPVPFEVVDLPGRRPEHRRAGTRARIRARPLRLNPTNRQRRRKS